MVKVLCIKANPKNVADSASLSVCEHFLTEYKKNNPQDQVFELDLYKEGMSHVDLNKLQRFTDPEGEVQKTARDFASYDKYIIASPMWNLSIPSILKAYIDHVVVSGISFQYTENGFPKGLLKNKKALCITARGGGYRFWPLSSFAFD